MNPRVALIAVASLLAALMLGGCGLEGQPFSTTTDKTTADTEISGSETGEFSPTVVTADAIAAFPKSSPEAAALEWWRAVQTRDPDAVLEAYSSDARSQLPQKFSSAIVTAISPIAAEASIEIVDVESEGDDAATVYVVISSSDSRLNGPLALPMKKAGDSWEITDPVFLGSIAEAVIITARLAEQTARDAGQ